jgi:hypothetical protein
MNVKFSNLTLKFNLTETEIKLSVMKHAGSQVCAAVSSICAFINFKLIKCGNCISNLRYGLYETKVNLNCVNKCSELIYHLFDFFQTFKEEYGVNFYND